MIEQIQEFASRVKAMRKEMTSLTTQIDCLEKEASKAGVVSSYVVAKTQFLSAICQKIKDAALDSEVKSLNFAISSVDDKNEKYYIAVYPDTIHICQTSTSEEIAIGYDGTILSADKQCAMLVCSKEVPGVQAPSNALRIRDFFLGLPMDVNLYYAAALSVLADMEIHMQTNRIGLEDKRLRTVEMATQMTLAIPEELLNSPLQDMSDCEAFKSDGILSVQL